MITYLGSDGEHSYRFEVANAKSGGLIEGRQLLHADAIAALPQQTQITLVASMLLAQRGAADFDEMARAVGGSIYAVAGRWRALALKDRYDDSELAMRVLCWIIEHSFSGFGNAQFETKQDFHQWTSSAKNWLIVPERQVYYAQGPGCGKPTPTEKPPLEERAWYKIAKDKGYVE